MQSIPQIDFSRPFRDEKKTDKFPLPTQSIRATFRKRYSQYRSQGWPVTSWMKQNIHKIRPKNPGTTGHWLSDSWLIPKRMYTTQSRLSSGDLEAVKSFRGDSWYDKHIHVTHLCLNSVNTKIMFRHVFPPTYLCQVYHTYCTFKHIINILDHLAESTNSLFFSNALLESFRLYVALPFGSTRIKKQQLYDTYTTHFFQPCQSIHSLLNHHQHPKTLFLGSK